MISLQCAPPGMASTRIHIGAASSRRMVELLSPRVDQHYLLLAERKVLGLHPHLGFEFARALIHVEGGETCKTMSSAEEVLAALTEYGIERGSHLIVVGGGALGDLGAFVASVALRGLELHLVPTTLLAMLDSSVGGKTALNLPQGKNLVGTYWPARTVVVDIDLIQTQPEVEFRAGLGEALKTAIGLDSAFFSWLELNSNAVLSRDTTALELVVARALQAKISIVEHDPFERGARRLLNLGHSLGHALEAWSDFTIPHGIAVARGLHFAIDLAQQRAGLAVADAARMRDLLVTYGFAATPLPQSAELREFLLRDKKMVHGQLQFVLPTGIGRSTVLGLPESALVDLH